MPFPSVADGLYLAFYLPAYVGVALLVVGVMVRALWVADIPVASVLGFLVMFSGAVLFMMSGRATAGAKGEKGSGGGQPAKSKSSFTQRMEERFRQRFEDQ